MKKVFYLLLFINTFVFAQSALPIASVRANNSNGEPVMSGQTVTIKGVVTASNHFGNSGPAAMQDSSAGISVYGSGFANQVKVGDSVIVTSSVTHYHGLTQLSFGTGSTVSVLSSDNNIEPQIVTLLDIANQQWNGVEIYESKLVKVKNVSINGSGNFEGNKNYTISDETGTLSLRIDRDVSSLVGSPIPSGKVDLIGIASQYKYSSPYNSGYQIIPRSINDIVSDDVPVILTPVIPADITTNSFTVYFKTVRKGNSEVVYGKTDALELGSVIIDDDTTEHKVTVSGLDEYTKYYFMVASTNKVGTSESEVQTVFTASSNPKTGTINVYFNSDVDTTVAIKGNAANGNVNFAQKVINRINQASYSIDIALYSFEGLTDVENAIIAAKNRGVKIRFVYENRAIQSGAAALLNAGILMNQKPDNSGIMHNKFAIFDARDNNPSNDWVWTGSWNWTTRELDWLNNVIEINDPSLAETYTKEFEEMWGSSTDVPDSAKASFGKYKTDNTTHSFNIGGIRFESYFSPSDQTETHIVNSIMSADSSVYFALLAFTSNSIYDAIETRHNNYYMNDGRGVIADANLNGSDFDKLVQLFPNEIFDQTTGHKLHNKFGIVDAAYVTSDPIVITGSHNWSNAANTRNDENTLIIHDPYIANQYMQAFKAIYNSAGGQSDFDVPVIISVKDEDVAPHYFTLKQNYPNPFNPTTTINYSIAATNSQNVTPVTLIIYDVLGREVATLVNKEQKPGNYSVKFDASNLGSGIYFYRLSSAGFVSVKKMTLLK